MVTSSTWLSEKGEGPRFKDLREIVCRDSNGGRITV